MWHGNFPGFDLRDFSDWPEVARVRVGFLFSFLIVSVLIGGKLYDLLEFN